MSIITANLLAHSVATAENKLELPTISKRIKSSATKLQKKLT